MVMGIAAVKHLWTWILFRDTEPDESEKNVETEAELWGDGDGEIRKVGKKRRERGGDRE